jgi:flagellar export protein FliJ
VRAFRFRLESVARVREHQERAAAQRVALATRDLYAARTRCAQIRAATRQLAFPVGHSDMAALRWVHDQSERMADLARRHDALAARAEVAANEARTAWMEAEQRCRALRRLEERQRDRWQVDADRAAVTELDDMATVRFRTGHGAP